MTRTTFLATYRAAVVAAYPWAQDAARLDRFMESVKTTLATETSPWMWNSPLCLVAWREIGGKGKPTLKALRALPA